MLKRRLLNNWKNVVQTPMTSCAVGGLRYPKRFSSSSQNQSDRKSYFHAVGKEPLQYTTLGKTAEEAANKWPDRHFIISAEENVFITFSELLQEADKLAAGLMELGLKKGDMVGLCAPNISQWAIIKTAVCRAGMRLAAINPAYQGNEIEYCVNKVGIKALFCMDKFKTQNYITMMQNIVPNLGKDGAKLVNSSRMPSLKSLVIISKENYPGTYKYDEFVSLASPTAVNLIAHMQQDIKPDDGCNIQFTSGTTGNPKAAELSHMNIVNNGYAVGKRLGSGEHHDKICLQVPYFHVFGVVGGFSSSVQYGSTLVLPSIGYEPKKSLQAIQINECSAIFGTPTMYVDLLSAKQSSGTEMKAKPRTALVGGAPCSTHLFQNIWKQLNLESAKSIFGMTEGTACSFCSQPGDSLEVAEEFVGYLQDHLEAKVVNENGKTINFGESGELLIRGYSVMLGYWDDEEKTREAIGPDRWLKTGDQFQLMENGYGKIVGRIKDTINRGGENIFPAEIENFLNTHPDILEAQVFGVADERLGEEVCAAVRVRGNSKLSQQELKKFCSGKIAHFKIPKYLKIMESFPRTASGKVQKYKIRQMVENT